MQLNALRTWGMATSAALMAAALGLSWQAPAPAVAQQTAPARVAQTQPAAPVGFLVRFRGTGPIARAQAAAARGQAAQAQRRIETQLARQTAFAGLCFDRFTVGAAEVVLRSCEPVPASDRAAYAQRWVARLQAMRAVAYADANATVSPTRAG